MIIVKNIEIYLTVNNRFIILLTKLNCFRLFGTSASRLLDNPMDLLAYAGARKGITLMRGWDAGVTHLLPRLHQLAWRICHTT